MHQSDMQLDIHDEIRNDMATKSILIFNMFLSLVVNIISVISPLHNLIIKRVILCTTLVRRKLNLSKLLAGLVVNMTSSYYSHNNIYFSLWQLFIEILQNTIRPS